MAWLQFLQLGHQTVKSLNDAILHYCNSEFGLLFKNHFISVTSHDKVLNSITMHGILIFGGLKHVKISFCIQNK